MPPRTRGKEDVVYALHSFEAENDDELSFEAGERIIVLERDDQYGDGWFQGRNTRNEVGLFPQSYTSDRPPSFYPFPDSALPSTSDSPSPSPTSGEATASPPTPENGETNGSIVTSSLPPPVAVTSGLPSSSASDQNDRLSPTFALTPSDPSSGLASANLPSPLGERSVRRPSASGASIHSKAASEISRDSFADDDDAISLHSRADEPVRRPEDGAAHRAALAARAMENAEKAAQEERDRQERRRKEDEERYLEQQKQQGLIEGLQLSDESGDEEEEVLQQRFDQERKEEKEKEKDGERKEEAVVEADQSQIAKDGEVAAKEVIADGGEAKPAVSAAVPPADAEPLQRPPLPEGLASQPSVYAESVYSTTSSSAPPTSSPPAVVADLPPASPPRAVPAPLTPSPAGLAISTAASTSSPPASPTKSTSASSPTSPSSVLDTVKSAATSTGAALAAGVTTAAAAAGLAVASAASTADGEKKDIDEEKPKDVALPTEAEAVVEKVPSPALEPETTALPVSIAASETAPQPITATTTAPSFAPAPISPPSAIAAISPSPEPSPAKSAAAGAIAPSLTASPSSAAFSAPHSGNGTSTAATSAPASESGMSAAGHGGSGKDLPADPMNWSVEDVVEWAKQKGFDSLTVSKFQEHEISGDVLLEMDVAMLKEIDLVAFGRRVHIYNAIKELRLRTHPELARSASAHPLGSSISSSYLSPMSGYEGGPDSPASMGGFGGSPQMKSPQMRWDQQHQQQGGQLNGLGFDTESQGGGSLRAPSSLGQQSVSNLRASRSSHGGTHQRSATGDSYPDSAPHSASSHGGGVALPAPVPPRRVMEEVVDATTAGEDSTTDVGLPTKREKKPSLRPSTAGSVKPKVVRRSTKDTARKSDTGGETPTSLPSSPNPSGTRKGSRSDRGDGGGKGFFGGTLPGLPGRARKPPPRVPSGLLLDSDGALPRPRPRSSVQDRAKRSTRLFGFGSTSGSEKSPTAVDSVRSRPSNSTLGNPREAPTTMKPKEVDPATKAMLREEAVQVKTGENLMDKIGRPDCSGWMRKKGEKYNTWKMRFFVLKGTYLYYLKSEQEQKAKGVIDLTGYRVISDPDIHPGEFGFKIVHDRARPHFFAAAEQITVRNWMKEIMKATILRDYTAPVVSSCDIEVLPLEVAQTMTPYPRPPTPTRRAQIQKERYAGTNPNTLSQKDAAILMDFAPGSPLMNGEALWSSASSKQAPPKTERKASAVSFGARSATSDTPTEHAPTSPVLGDATPKLNGTSSPFPVTQTRLTRATSDTSKGELLAWVNANLPSTCPLALDLSHSLRSGRLLVRLTENLSGAKSEITDTEFEQFHQQEGMPFDTAYLDVCFSVFDYLSPHVSTDDISMEDMITGNEERLTLLIERIREKYPQPATVG
ncbi:hypothetical protein JCM11251_005217 [Rhodosporidiobolus azoricus]